MIYDCPAEVEALIKHPEDYMPLEPEANKDKPEDRRDTQQKKHTISRWNKLQFCEAASSRKKI
ncbi:hypothetical protein GCM10025791_40170 [Halioxenophilus aromaticivorans]|uniref:Uncharacterized protein n=1 Tax=Halioxenophilus aromaticivorans TaxID=1306992 RepID=A0AAV3U846_9ALTE|nr:hypothetical protein [Oleispira sp.]|tara:strand:- start:12044 stop:12232 length:189 start_codon:yes stop_codon:yes gene_type:complete